MSRARVPSAPGGCHVPFCKVVLPRWASFAAGPAATRHLSAPALQLPMPPPRLRSARPRGPRAAGGLAGSPHLRRGLDTRGTVSASAAGLRIRGGVPASAAGSPHPRRGQRPFLGPSAGWSWPRSRTWSPSGLGPIASARWLWIPAQC